MRKSPPPERKKCENCGRPYTVSKRDPRFTAKKYLPQFDYCSGSCLRDLIKKNGIQYKRTRSKPEIFLEELVRKDFPTVQYTVSDRDTLRSGLEIDLFFPLLKVGVETNGICHSEAIYGKKSLNRTQRNDSNKAAECKLKGITLLIMDIADVSEKGMHDFIKAWYREFLVPVLKGSTK